MNLTRLFDFFQHGEVFFFSTRWCSVPNNFLYSLENCSISFFPKIFLLSQILNTFVIGYITSRIFGLIPGGYPSAVEQAAACTPVTPRARVRSRSGQVSMVRFFSGFFLTCKTSGSFRPTSPRISFSHHNHQYSFITGANDLRC